MKVIMKKIKRDEVDPLMDNCIKEFKSRGQMDVSLEKIEEISDPVIYKGKVLEVDMDLDCYNSIISSDIDSSKKKAMISVLLYNDFKQLSEEVPFAIIFNEDMWSYLCLTVYKEMIYSLLFDGDKYLESRIRRYYFNTNYGFLDRTSFRFFWFFAYCMEGDKQRLDIAFEYIDPVKAVFERSMAKNVNITKAFVDAIIANADLSVKMKRDPYRAMVPKNYNSYSALMFIDNMEYDELVLAASKVQSQILSKDL